MEISFKSGIQHRFGLSEFKLGELKNFMEFSTRNFKIWLIQFHIDVFLDVFHEKKSKIKNNGFCSFEKMQRLYKFCLEIKGRGCCMHIFQVETQYDNFT